MAAPQQDVPAIPRPAYCPECGADYAGGNAFCVACGYDAGGELVLYESDQIWRQPGEVREWRRSAWTFAAWGIFVASVGGGVMWLLGPVDDSDKNITLPEWGFAGGGMLAFIGGLLVLTGVGARLWSRGLVDGVGLLQYRTRQRRYSVRGTAKRRGVGPVRWEPWPARASVKVRPVGSKLAPSAVRVGIRQPGGYSDESFPLDPLGVGNESLQSLLNVFVERGSRELLGVAAEHQFPDETGVTHCPDCGHFLADRPPPEPGQHRRCPECGWRGEAGEIVLFGRNLENEMTAKHWAIMAGVLLGLMLLSKQLDRMPPAWAWATCGLLVVLPIGGLVVLVAWHRGRTEHDRRDAVIGDAAKPPGDDVLRLRRDGYSIAPVGRRRWVPWDEVRSVSVFATTGNHVRITPRRWRRVLSRRLYAARRPFLCAAPEAAVALVEERLRGWGVDVNARR